MILLLPISGDFIYSLIDSVAITPAPHGCPFCKEYDAAASLFSSSLMVNDRYGYVYMWGSSSTQKSE